MSVKGQLARNEDDRFGALGVLKGIGQCQAGAEGMAAHDPARVGPVPTKRL
jgi:hypothetical protein